MRSHSWQVRDWMGEHVLRCADCGIHGPLDDVDWKTRKDGEGCNADQPSPAHVQGKVTE